MQQQQVSTLQIRALGALCRLLSQVWRRRITLAIPRLHEVWTKCAANLFCAELEEEKKHNRNMFWFIYICLPFALRCLFTMCYSWVFFFSCCCCWWWFLSVFQYLGGTSEYVCSGSNGYFNRTASDIKSTTKHQTQHRGKKKTKKKTIQSNKLNQTTRTKRECEHWHRNYWSWGNWQDQRQASVLHMACHFHSFHKENTKSVISHYLRLINNNPDMLNLSNAATKTWGKRSSWKTLQLIAVATWWAVQPELSKYSKWSRPPTNSMRCQSGNWSARMTFSSNQARWFLNTE